MPRIRTIQPSFPKSPSTGRVSPQARLLFIQLWTVADDAGRLRADLRTLLDQLYPYDTDVAMFLPAWLDELEHEGCIERYAADGAEHLRVAHWRKYQKVDRPTASRLPSLNERPRDSRKVLERSRNLRECTPNDLEDKALSAILERLAEIAESEKSRRGHGRQGDPDGRRHPPGVGDAS